MCGFHGGDNDRSTRKDFYRGVKLEGFDKVILEINKHIEAGKCIKPEYSNDYKVYRSATAIVDIFLKETKSKSINYQFNGIGFTLSENGNSSNREMVDFAVFEIID